MNGPEGFLPKNQNFTTQVARILWYRPFWYLVLTRVTTNECYKSDNAALLYTMCLPSRLGSLLVIITIFFILASNIIERKKV